MSDEDPQERCDICHRLVPMFTLVIEAGLPHRRLCSLCRFDRDSTDPEQRGYARGFAQGIAYAKARQKHADRDPDLQETP